MDGDFSLFPISNREGIRDDLKSFLIDYLHLGNLFIVLLFDFVSILQSLFELSKLLHHLLMLCLHYLELSLQFLVLTDLLLICAVGILEVRDNFLMISEYLLIPILPLSSLLILFLEQILLVYINPPLLVLKCLQLLSVVSLLECALLQSPPGVSHCRLVVIVVNGSPHIVSLLLSHSHTRVPVIVLTLRSAASLRTDTLLFLMRTSLVRTLTLVQ